MKSLYFVAVAVALSSGPVYAACTYPKAPESLPDGNTATLEQMVAAQKAVKQFDQEITAYTSCIKLEHDTTLTKEGEKMTDEQKAEMSRVQVQKHNAAVEEDEALAARFNEQVKVFKAKSDKNKK
jgi:hypothetical protein